MGLPPATINRAVRSEQTRRSGVMLSDDELVEARATIVRPLDEDLRSGPDITTAATVPAGAVTTASLITREPGVIAGVDIAILVLDEVLGRAGYRIVNRVEDGARLGPGAAALTVGARGTAPKPRFAIPVRRCPVCAPCRNTRSGSVVASTIGSA